MEFSSHSRIIQTIAGPGVNGVRLDCFLSARFTYQSRTAWQKLILDGRIKINGCHIRPARRLQTGDTILFDAGGFPEPEVDTHYSVVLETPQFLVVSKSGNIPVHPSGRYFAHTLQIVLREKYGDLYPVNRLDRETSGLVLFAKTADAAKHLNQLFSKQKVKKEYLAIVFGVFPHAEQVSMKGFLSSDPDSAVRKKRLFTPEGEFVIHRKETETVTGSDAPESCETMMECLCTNGRFSMVKCCPLTGRLHQIRATLCSMGFPLVGDKMYGPDELIFTRFINGSMTESDWKALILPTQALHAWKLCFTDPFTGKSLYCESPIPAVMETLPCI